MHTIRDCKIKNENMKPPFLATEVCDLILDCKTYEDMSPIREYINEYKHDWCLVDLKFIFKFFKHKEKELFYGTRN